MKAISNKKLEEDIKELQENLDSNVKWLSDFIINSNALHKIEMEKLKEDISDLRKDVINLGRVLILNKGG